MPDGLPSPPARLDDYAPRSSEIRVLPAQTPLWRLYKRQPYDTTWDTFRSHGPTNSRFDHHLSSPDPHHERSILYAASDWRTCVAEVFQEDRLIDTHRHEPRLAVFTFASDIRLLNLNGPWPTRARGSMAISSGDRGTARAWSRAIYAAFPSIHGLHYNSAMNAGKPSYVFYERAQQHLSDSADVDMPLNHPEIAVHLERLARALGYDIL